MPGGADAGGAASEPDPGRGPLAANAAAIPQRDPRDSCDGLDLVLGPMAAPGACPPVKCGCLEQDLTSAVEANRCVASIDCDAYCALKNDGYLRLFFCAYLPSCTQDSECMATQSCVRPPGERLGVCSGRATGNECFTHTDCDSNACVVDADDGRASCGGVITGSECNLDQHCLSGKCVLAAHHYLGACAGDSVNAPCLSNDDCSVGLTCVKDLFTNSAAPVGATGLGACSNGFPGSPCQTPSDCLGGYVCLPNHQCSAGNVGDPCESNADCPGNFCSSASGPRVCTAGELGAACTDVSECRTPLCTAGRCSDGAPGSMCYFDTDCIGGSCVLSPNLCSDGALGHACDNFHPCQPGLACNMLQCEPG